MGLDVIGIKFTNDWKNKAVRRLATDLEQGNAFILDHQIGEFEGYEYDITPGGRITYSAPEGMHDDEVSAKLLEHWVLVTESFTDNPVREVRLRPREADLPAGPKADALTQPIEQVEPDSVDDMMERPEVWDRR
jgi:hypothetical protein